MNVLIVEDDYRAARLLVAALSEIGYETVVAEDGRIALALASAQSFDAVLLDVMLPQIDGVAVARALRERGLNVPILMLTALGDLDERLAGLDAGADDYLVKPAEPLEIDARIKAIKRRAERTNETGVLRAGDIEVNEIKFRAVRGRRVLALPKLEFQVLCELVRNRNSVVTRTMFYSSVWGFDFEPTTNIVESYIRRVRVQLTLDGEEDPIVTIRGVGYMMIGEG
ncbi:response regulator transcription factor [Sphingomonas psychrolutea]|uniref:DNA-binding response regulator n=1 Tax=Sphingomonas psychrolutea TaxID=1259676 RepID=A0ABQ1H208_9SPHN|nr:response regulator transcription factor [Sphingomonas psychrolutea]GGA56066.1 DNA-binding response regulator [Sphingomonas psychrolutea]